MTSVAVQYPHAALLLELFIDLDANVVQLLKNMQQSEIVIVFLEPGRFDRVM